MEAIVATQVAQFSRLLPSQQLQRVQHGNLVADQRTSNTAAIKRTAGLSGLVATFDLGLGGFRSRQINVDEVDNLRSNWNVVLWVARRKRHRQRQRRAINVISWAKMDAELPFSKYDDSMIEAGSQEPETEKTGKLKVGIVGFGSFGQFLAERMSRRGHQVLAHSRRDYSAQARELGVSYFRDADDFCEEYPEVVLLCTSIISAAAVLQSLPLQRLKRHTLFVDVLSVKQFPKNLFLQVLPPEFDVLCTHPMFGPESGKASWAGLPFVYDKVRVSPGPRSSSAERFLDIFASEGCRMVEMSCAEHDRVAAGTQFITHTVGRILGKLELESTPMDTRGYETLRGVVQNTCGDSVELYHGLFLYNPNASEELKRFEIAFDSIKNQLFGQLHNVLRNQAVGGAIATKGSLSQKFVNSSLQFGSSKPSGPGPLRIAMKYNTLPLITEQGLN